jgi:branched-chain amino acid transport system ATP-binding protein
VAALLEVSHLTTGYGRVEVLHDLSFSVPAGCVVALLGPNGAGKTTTLRAISGTLPVWRGTIRLGGRRIDGRSAYAVARQGVILVPEGRGIFPGLNVRENLDIGVHADPDLTPAGRGQRVDEVLTVFPRLGERLDQRAASLSGGEQQMLALSRALLARPRILLMDEISMGLAPLIVEQLFSAVERLRASGITIVMVEQYLTYALRLADICYVLGKGRVGFVGEPDELRGSDALAGAYLGSA